MCSLFLFKQKTAYEMRISDWSSDVCSSDLAGGLLTAASGMGGKSMVPRWCRADWRFGSSFPARWRNLKRMPSGAVGSAVRVHHSQGHWIPAFAEIGRASCRERVCQYV